MLIGDICIYIYIYHVHVVLSLSLHSCCSDAVEQQGGLTLTTRAAFFLPVIQVQFLRRRQ